MLRHSVTPLGPLVALDTNPVGQKIGLGLPSIAYTFNDIRYVTIAAILVWSETVTVLTFAIMGPIL